MFVVRLKQSLRTNLELLFTVKCLLLNFKEADGYIMSYSIC